LQPAVLNQPHSPDPKIDPTHRDSPTDNGDRLIRQRQWKFTKNGVFQKIKMDIITGIKKDFVT
jgi:hypothetical protein